MTRSASDQPSQGEASRPISGDQRRFLQLVARYEKMLLKVCWAYSRTEHDRDDLLQEILARLWASFSKYDPARSFSTWMYRVALNVAIDSYRRRGRRREVVDSSTSDAAFAPSDDEKDEQLKELHEMLSRHSEVDRAILVLHLEGHTHGEVAAVIGLSESNVGTRLSRLKKSLRESATRDE